jgi:hypothetical protein
MITRLAVVVLLSVLSARIADASSFGRTSGQFGVSTSGSAQYVIPIWAPPGPRGVQPKISLVYDSQAGIGTVGLGWTLSGLGSISRCNRTFAQDTVPAPVALATTDGYCINGKRLRLTGGTYGADASTYQTEIADFSSVTAHGAAGQGPAYFTVQARDGVTYDYGFVDANGNGANSQVLATGTTTAAAWMLSKVIDRAGNNYVINYSSSSGTAIPSAILWTPTSAGASTYTYSMQFNYTILSKGSNRKPGPMAPQRPGRTTIAPRQAVSTLTTRLQWSKPTSMWVARRSIVRIHIWTPSIAHWLRASKCSAERTIETKFNTTIWAMCINKRRRAPLLVAHIIGPRILTTRSIGC